MIHVDQLQNFRLQSSKIHVKNTQLFFFKNNFRLCIYTSTYSSFCNVFIIEKSIYYLYAIISLTMITKKVTNFERKNLFFLKLIF